VAGVCEYLPHQSAPTPIARATPQKRHPSAISSRQTGNASKIDTILAHFWTGLFNNLDLRDWRLGRSLIVVVLIKRSDEACNVVVSGCFTLHFASSFDQPFGPLPLHNLSPAQALVNQQQGFPVNA
jgi:hypothetical protein